MDEATLFTLLKTTKLPVARGYFKAPPLPPYIVWLGAGISKQNADNKVYVKENNYRVELYTEKKEPDTEKLLEDLFDANDISYEKSEDIDLPSEELLEVYYEI